MKFVLGFLVCCFLVIAGTIILAPEYAHEIIDGLHSNPSNPNRSQVSEGNNKNNNNEANEDDTGIATSEPDGESGVLRYIVSPIQPRNKQQMLYWLNSEGYRVEAEQGFYRISWQTQEPTSSKPVSIRLKDNGTIISNYEKGVSDVIFLVKNEETIFADSTITTSRGDINVTRFDGGIDIVIGSAEIIIKTKDRITITVFAKYKNSSWGLEITRSFVWDPSRDKIEDVRSKAKKIKNS